LDSGTFLDFLIQNTFAISDLGLHTTALLKPVNAHCNEAILMGP